MQISSSLKGLLNGLLAKNPMKRIGFKNGIDDILTHPWLSQVDINKILNKQVEPPFKPKRFSFNFDENEFSKGEKEFLSEINHLQVIKSH